MLIGQFASQLDQKGQFKIPDTFLGFLVSGAVATYGVDGNLLLFPLSYWGNLAKEIVQLPFSKEANRSFRRFFFSGAITLNPDNKGMIALTPQLKQYAGIGQEIVIVGVYDYIEIWDKNAWDIEHNQIIDSTITNKARWEMLGI